MKKLIDLKEYQGCWLQNQYIKLFAFLYKAHKKFFRSSHLQWYQNEKH